MTTPTALTHPAQLVDRHLEAVLIEKRSEWMAIDPMLAEPVDHLEHLVLAGGKRVRPAMAYWGFVGAGGDAEDTNIVALGSALELLQAFALFHDDVMDGANTRRGRPTSHTMEIERHRESDWGGEARRYGEAVAILAGDVSLVLSDVLLAEANPLVRRLWNELRIEVNLGQYLDVVGTARAERSPATADRIIEYKTARYTIVRPLQMGAALANREDLLDPFSEIGTPLGIAFQLRDDLLGAFGESSVTGKPVGDDLREGKPTPLLAAAWSRADAAQRAILQRVGGEPNDDEIAEMQGVLKATGAVEVIEQRIDDLTARSLDALARTPLASGAGAQLSEIAQFLASRSY